MIKNLMLNSLGILLTALYLVLLSSCNKIEPEFSRLSELGTETNTYTVPAAAGEVEVSVLSNEDYNIFVPDSINWLSVSSNKLNGDAKFKVNYKQNPEFRRKGIVVLFAEKSNRYDTVTIKQEGTLTPELNFPVINISVLGDGGNIVSKLLMNIPMDILDINIIYPDISDDEPTPTWVKSDFNYDQGNQEFSFTIAPNPDNDALRSAQIQLSFTDGWGEKVESSLYLLQANAQNLFGTKTSFLDVRSWAGEKVSADIFIEGYIVSDKDNKNMGDNPQTTPTKIDYTQNQKTVYVESLDGKYGFRIITATPGDNIFKRYSKVQIRLKGATVEEELNPTRYTIMGITSSMVMSQEQKTSADIVLKEKYMSELTDDDIYTYVTLKDCEMPIRKGSFTPVNEGYTPLFTADRLSKYPLLIRDIQGTDMFLFTNLEVGDRRDGSILPQGSGKISGIIVHEQFTRFNDEDGNTPDENGNIGKYQIRWLNKTDIDLNPNFNDGFSSLLVEYLYPNIVSGKALPTNGDNGQLYASNSVNVGASTTYYYLGPCGANNMGNINQWGTGVVINGNKQNTATGTNSTGKGETSGDAIAATRSWWNYAEDRGEAWIIEFSTLGVVTNQLSLQFSALNWGSTNGARFWVVEWSENSDMNGSWNPITKYTVPDVSNWSNTLLNQLPAFKNINVKLPLDLLGKSKVYLRLKVDKNLCSNGNTYASEPISGNLNSSLGYLAIRYNK